MKTLVAVVMLSFSTVAFAQCNQPVWDRTNALDPSALGSLAISTAKLTDLGADTHLVIFGPTESVAAAQSSLERECPTWLGPTGVRASTLLVVGVSPASHKSWISYGSAWHHALDENFNRIRTDDMNPMFKNREWGKGLEAGADALTSRISAAKDESLHPASTTVQATDLKPAASAFVLVVEIMIGGLVLAGLVFWWFAWREKKRKTQIAQQLASSTRSDLASRMQKLEQDVTQYVADRGANSAVVTSALDRLSEDFARYSNSEKTNPETLGLSQEEYAAITSIYTQLAASLEGCYRVMRPGAKPEAFSAAETSRVYARQQSSGKGGKGQGGLDPQAHSEQNIYVQNQGNSSFSDGLLGGIIGADLTDRRRDDDYRPSYNSPSSHNPPEPSSSSSSSSWGSSSSSSDSGGGGGSDWSSSSDSGGGGGSDFSSSSDSGGGGGGDF